ncbi:MAG: GNAT family N-acetyltransferase [Chryseolinea sp.]
MELEFQYQRLTRNSDLHSLAQLVKLCFNMDVDQHYFNWKYFDNPCGEVLAYVAISDSKIISFYGVIPEWYWENGEIVKIYQSMDTMTHPDFRRMGLFVKLAKLCFKDLDKENTNYLAIGFPAPASYSGFVKKLGWSTVFFNRLWFCYSFVFKAFSVASRFPSEVSCHPVDINSPHFEEYFKGKEPLASIEKYVDSRIFKWKVMDNKHKKYEAISIHKDNAIIGLAVYYLDTPKSCLLVWVDFYNPSNYQLNVMGSLIKHLFLITKKRCIYIWGPTLDIQKRAFKKAGFIMNPFNKGPFHQKFSFITLADKNRRGLSRWNNQDHYNFQGIMLD